MIAHQLKKEKVINWLLLLFGLLIFLYTFFRAKFMSITYDEAFCYSYYVRNNLFYSAQTCAVNIQLLNNFLMILSTKLFGITELTLRLPNLFAHVLFLIFSAKFVKKITSQWWILFAFVILNLNPFVLDFFSLARQYGLASAFTMGSIFYLYQYIEENKKIKYSFLSMLFAVLAAFTSIPMLSYCLVLFGVFFLMEIIEVRSSNLKLWENVKQVFKKTALIQVLLFLLLIIIVPEAIKMREAQQLFYGGHEGFYKDTVLSLIYGTLYSQWYIKDWMHIMVLFFILLIISSAAFFLVKKVIRKTGKIQFSLSDVILILILGCALSSIVQFYLLGTLFLIYRTGIFYIILFNVLFVSVISEFIKTNKRLLFIGGLITCLMVVHFIFSFNTKRVISWTENSNIKDVVGDINNLKQSTLENYPLLVYTSPILQPGVDFYRDINNFDWLNQAIYDQLNKHINYFYFSKEEYNAINKDSITVIKTYQPSKTVLAKRSYEPKQVVVLQEQVNDMEHNTNDKIVETPFFSGSHSEKLNEIRQFSSVLNIEIDSLNHPFSKLVASAEVFAHSISKQDAEMVFAIDRKGELIFYNKGFVKDFLKKDNQWTTVNFSSVLPKKVLHPGDIVAFYVWTPSGEELFVDDLRLSWIEEKFE